MTLRSPAAENDTSTPNYTSIARIGAAILVGEGGSTSISSLAISQPLMCGAADVEDTQHVVWSDIYTVHSGQVDLYKLLSLERGRRTGPKH